MSGIEKLTDEGLHELSALLEAEAMPGSAMDLAQLEGFLTAIVIGPRSVPIFEWLPWVADAEDGTATPTHSTVEEARELLRHVMGLLVGVADAFRDDPESFVPVYLRDARWQPEAWCDGFIQATQTFHAEEWDRLWTLDAQASSDEESHESLFAPFTELSSFGNSETSDDSGDRERWVAAIVPALTRILTYWQLFGPEAERSPVQEPFRRPLPKVGRNDPCPCGSGRKYKKCCAGD